MYLFSITINVDDEVREELLEWVNGKIRPLLTDKALVYDFRVLKILSDETGHGTSYSFQYHLHNWEGVETFEERYDNEVAAGMYRFYKEKFVEFRTRLELINWKF